MKGHILLEGGAEFGGQMAEADLVAIELAGGFQARIRIIPAAAAPEQDHLGAGRNGVRWFNNLGASDVVSLPLIDRASADQPDIAAALHKANLIYLLGGSPSHLYLSLVDSLSWQAIVEAYQARAVIAGSSAGAMVLCQHFYDPHSQQITKGLNLIPNSCVLPHHNNFGQRWAESLLNFLPEDVLIGIDEETGIIDNGYGSRWTVYGKGGVTLYKDEDTRTYPPGETFSVSLSS